MQSKKIIVLEDDTAFRKLITSEINKVEAFECIGTFSKIQELMQAVPDLFPDLFWLDISLPDGLSINSIPQLKEMFPNALCLICSMHDDDDKVFTALKSGADGYLLKNSSFEVMMTSINELFQGGSPMSPFIARKVINHMKTENRHDPLKEQLTKREYEILANLAQGFQYKEVAHQLSVSLETIKKHVQNIYKKLHVQNRTEAIIKFHKK
ncbi:LuxR C-terminal-related transcriptional regulator [Flavobacterium sp.]|jgi:NarL family two-component system response regulator LiaR|uniref:LuxR C-terminal-related transcriptional regulator n=1 Tax=Flavobacterium sp. TaxID=239 RepID=UPI0037C0A8A7